MIVVCMLLKKRCLIRQLVSDLPLARLAAHKSPFFHSKVNYLGPLNFAEGRSNKKSWGSCLHTWHLGLSMSSW